MLFGMPLKYVSLLTLAVQNAALTVVMHYSRVSTPPSLSYSPATAVLLNEIIKGSISFVIAFLRTSSNPPASPSARRFANNIAHASWFSRLRFLLAEILAPDCVKLSIPAILYVIQNSLQFVAISNLPVASFQVAYQMKILTTAAFSVALLGRRLTNTKWMALFFLALGVGIVQIQTTAGSITSVRHDVVGSAAAAAPNGHVMNPLKGFAAVTAACFTSGLAGVYFEMVLKGSKADLWIRNVQLSLFSLIPALVPIIYAPKPAIPSPVPPSLFGDLFKNFGGWAWATVMIQVFGGLVTALVIKYSDNIMKGFATSLSIIISFLASVILFNFKLTPSFMLGSTTVLVATWMYNQPSVGPPTLAATTSAGVREKEYGDSAPWSPVGKHDPILGEKPTPRKSSASSFLSRNSSTQSLANFFGLAAHDHEKAQAGVKLGVGAAAGNTASAYQSEDEASTHAYTYSKSSSYVSSLSSSYAQLYTPSRGPTPYASRSGSPSPPASEPPTPNLESNEPGKGWRL